MTEKVKYMISRQSPLTGFFNTREIEATRDQWARFLAREAGENTETIQAIFPDLSPGTREFLITGYTERDWAAIFGPETRNARFWEWVNGSPVKITLRPGQSLSWRTGRQHEEGWSTEDYTWTHEGEEVRVEWCEDGTDCDGCLTNEGASTCRLEDLGAGWSPEPGIAMPAWNKGTSNQRDYSAEAAGY